MAADLVDLRSDTVTRPSREMRAAMASADVGDDAYGEDPTVRALEEAFAERVGKEASLFVCSGLMGNQVALRCLAAAGTVVVAGRRQHVVAYEKGAAARNAGVQFHTVADPYGHFTPEDVTFAVDSSEHHQPQVSLVCAEDTHMASGGRPWPKGDLDRIADAAGIIPLHLDGARLFNAEVATGVPASSRAAAAVTVMCCLSKGLGAPVGSLLAGPAAVIERARHERAVLGGAMRQSGILAAAGLVALGNVERLADDHRRAETLAGAVMERWPEGDCDVPATNIVTFGHPLSERFLAHMRAYGVLVGTIGPARVRMVTHLDVDDAGVERACAAVACAPG